MEVADKIMVEHAYEPDSEGRIFCRKAGKLIEFAWETCIKCPCMTDNYDTVICSWEDCPPVEAGGYRSIHTNQATSEYLRVMQLIDMGKLPAKI